jgi:hypothetical protein
LDAERNLFQGQHVLTRLRLQEALLSSIFFGLCGRLAIIIRRPTLTKSTVFGNIGSMIGAGDSLEDYCRVCKMDRGHTVIVADSNGSALRVICDYCGSQHNYRGKEGIESRAMPRRETNAPPQIPLVSDRERRFPVTDNALDLEMLLRRIIREEIGLTPVPIAEKWRGGELILRPGKENLQEKSWPIETFFHKIVMIRNRLRVLEQQINGVEIAEDLKIKLQAYITACYGSLTSFNILFAEEDDRFQGNAGSD